MAKYKKELLIDDSKIGSMPKMTKAEWEKFEQEGRENASRLMKLLKVPKVA